MKVAVVWAAVILLFATALSISVKNKEVRMFETACTTTCHGPRNMYTSLPDYHPELR